MARNHQTRASKIDLLRRSPLLTARPHRDLVALARIADIATFSTGATITTDHEHPRWVYLVLHGTVEAVDHHTNQRLPWRSPVIGDIAALTGVPSTPTIIASTTVQAAILPASHYPGALEAQPALLCALRSSLRALLQTTTTHPEPGAGQRCPAHRTHNRPGCTRTP